MINHVRNLITPLLGACLLAACASTHPAADKPPTPPADTDRAHGDR